MRFQIFEYACLNLNSKLKIIKYVSEDGGEETLMTILYSNNNINKANK